MALRPVVRRRSGNFDGYGTYSVMPIPYFMALGWFLGTLVQALAGGWIIGLIIREPKPEPGEAAA